MRSAYSSIQLSAARASILELADERTVAGPALVLVEQHDVQRRRVGAAVVRRVRALLERGHLAVAHLVEDPAGILVAEVVEPHALPVAERAKRRRGELRRERQRLQAREDAVAPEHRHEPGQAGSRQRAPACDRRREAERREVDEAPPVRRLERLPVALDAGRVVDPALEVAAHPSLGSRRVACFERRLPAPHARGHDVDAGRPLAVRRDPHVEGEALGVELGRRGRGDRGGAGERPALVAQGQQARLDVRRVPALLLRARPSPRRGRRSRSRRRGVP